MQVLSRREFLLASTALALGSAARAQSQAKTVAAIITEFRLNSHADVITNRWMEGFELDGMSERPRSKLVAMYTDQVPEGDLSRKLSEKYKVPIYPTIREALCRGGDKLAVDGVTLIGEHGKYPFNEKGQHLYPRRRFLAETVEVFRDNGRVVPVFSDKHLSYSWENAKWMYDQSRELKFPFLAGSSLPTAWRHPAFELEAGTPVSEALVASYGGNESYGFHALETLQCLMERRKGGETGVVAVTCVEGPAVWKAAEDKKWSRSLLDAAVATASAATKKGSPEKECKNPAAFLLDYKDGCKATILMLNGFTREFLFAAKLSNKTEPVATNVILQDGRPHGHFTFLVQAIDDMVVSGKAGRPVERTLLTTGVLDAALTSIFQGHKRLETPFLEIAYSPGPAWKQPPLPQTGPKLPI